LIIEDDKGKLKYLNDISPAVNLVTLRSLACRSQDAAPNYMQDLEGLGFNPDISAKK